ncbi:potassium channel family protein [Agrobacterium sp. NPDC090283]|uniref:potassium channel family protein n=1 Tax=Agrobacterium sp. NPDC090283 TaxID=3363920 RepID=UPI00383B1F69
MMVHRNVGIATLMIWASVLAVVLFTSVPSVLPPVTQCVPTFDGDIVGHGTDLIPFLAVAISLTLPFWFIYQFLKRQYSVAEFLLVIFSTYLLNIVLFALIFHSMGIIDTGVPPTEGTGVSTNFADYIYFSAVTFTTLGYGDFKPCEADRLFAALEALLGGFFMPFSSAVVLAQVLKDDKRIDNPAAPAAAVSALLPWRSRVPSEQTVEMASVASADEPQVR